MDVQKMCPYNELINAQVSVICIRADRVYILLVFAWFYLESRWALERLLSSRQSSLTCVASDCTPTISSAEKRGRVLLHIVLWDASAKARDYRPAGSWKFIKPRSNGGERRYVTVPVSLWRHRFVLQAKRFWLGTVSLLDVMWPRSNQWERALLGTNFQLDNNIIYWPLTLHGTYLTSRWAYSQVYTWHNT